MNITINEAIRQEPVFVKNTSAETRDTKVRDLAEDLLITANEMSMVSSIVLGTMATMGMAALCGSFIGESIGLLERDFLLKANKDSFFKIINVAVGVFIAARVPTIATKLFLESSLPIHAEKALIGIMIYPYFRTQDLALGMGMSTLALMAGTLSYAKKAAVIQNPDLLIKI